MRYFGAGAPSPIGTSSHLTPVGKPAPPRPRRFEALTIALTSAGVSSLSAFLSPRYPPARSYSLRESGSASGRMFCVRGRALLITGQRLLQRLGGEVEVEIVVHQHHRRAVAGAQAGHGQERESPVFARLSKLKAKLLEALSELFVAQNPAADAVAE